jgi:hypothetical protein
LFLLTKALLLAWAGIGGLFGANYGGVAAAAGPASALAGYGGGLFSPLTVMGAVTAIWAAVDFRVHAKRKARTMKAILADKPGLANDPRALRRERRIREKEALLERREHKALAAEDRAERRIVRDTRREGTLERKRESLEVKKDALRKRQQLGR